MSDFNGVRLLADGNPIQYDAGQALVGLLLERTLHSAGTLSLRVTTGNLNDTVPVAYGAELVFTNKNEKLFVGTVDQVTRRYGEQGATIELRASDSLALLSKQRNLVARDISSIHSFTRDLAAQAGLSFTCEAADFAVGRHLHRFDNDLLYLTQTLARYAMSVRCLGSTLALIDLHRARQSHQLADLPVTTYSQTSGVPQSVAGWTGWSAGEDQTIRSGFGTLATALNLRRKETGPIGVPVRVGEPASRLAVSANLLATSQAHRVSAEIATIVNYWPGDQIQLPTPDSEPLILSEVTIMIDAADGARTLLDTRLEPMLSASTELLTGIVESITDPERSGRVQVGVTGLGGLRTGWLPVTGAFGLGGGGTGLAIPLSVGDPVALLAAGGDPELGIVLGGIARAGGVHQELVNGEKRRALSLRAAGAQIEMNEREGLLSLSLDDGTLVELAKERITLKAAQHIDFLCEGKVRIRGSRIEFEEA